MLLRINWKKIQYIVFLVSVLIIVSIPANSNQLNSSDQNDAIAAVKQSHNIQEQIQLINKNVEVYPNNIMLLNLQKNAYFNIDRYVRAKEILQKIIKINPKYPNYPKEILFLNLKIHQLRVEKKSLTAKLQNKLNLLIRLKLIDIELSLNDYPAVRKTIEDGLKIDPKNTALLFQKAAMLADLQKYVDAVSTLKILLSVDAGDHEAKNLMNKLQPFATIEAKQIAAKEKLEKEQLIKLALEKQKEENKLVQKIEPVKPKPSPVDQLLEDRKFREAIALIDSYLLVQPANIDLLYKKAQIYAEIESYDKAVTALNQIFDLQKDDDKATQLLKKIEVLDKTNLSGLNTLFIGNESNQTRQVNSTLINNSLWTYSIFSYSRRFRNGTLVGQVNQASRFGQYGSQYQFSAYPKLIGNSYGYLSYAFSSSTLYPKAFYIGEIYFPMSSYFEMSGGASFYNILLTNMIMTTNSLTANFDPYSFTVRTNFYVPDSGPHSVFWLFTGKKYFKNPDNYVALQIQTGKTPDLADLTSVGFFTLSSNGIRLLTQFHLKNGVFMLISMGDVRETFFGTSSRNKLFGAIALKFRF